MPRSYQKPWPNFYVACGYRTIRVKYPALFRVMRACRDDKRPAVRNGEPLLESGCQPGFGDVQVKVKFYIARNTHIFRIGTYRDYAFRIRVALHQGDIEVSQNTADQVFKYRIAFVGLLRKAPVDDGDPGSAVP